MRCLAHSSTSLLRSRVEFARLLESIHDACKDRLLLFSLSHDTPDLEQSIRQLSSCTTESLGCLSGPLPVQLGRSFFSCSIAIFERNSCIPFSSLETGDGPISVGRWHTYDERKTNGSFDEGEERGLHGQVNWDEVWNARGSLRYVPQELKNVRDARTLLYFCDTSSWNFAAALQRHLPHANQLGVIASSTPFITGHPFTLFRNGKVQSSGAVGLALKNDPLENVSRFDGVTRLTRPLVVRRSEGNLIHELEHSLPARILMEAIQNHGLPEEHMKDIDYYIGLREEHEQETNTVPAKLLKIIAGSPSRGSIAVEEVPAPPAGSRIEFFYRRRTSLVQLPTDILEDSKAGSVIGAFVDAPENYAADLDLDLPNAKGIAKDSLPTYHSSFVVSTEHGFLRGTGSSANVWKCTVPGAFSGVRVL